MNYLCNMTKHVKPDYTSVKYGLPDQCPDTDSLADWDKGPPLAFYYKGSDISEIMKAVIDFYQEVIDFYQDKWFRSEDIAWLLKVL